MPKRRRILLGAAVLLSAWIAFDSLLDPSGWGRLRRLQADLSALRAENAAAQARAVALRAQIQALRSRPEVQERVVRHELGFVRPGEVVLTLEAEPP